MNARRLQAIHRHTNGFLVQINVQVNVPNDQQMVAEFEPGEDPILEQAAEKGKTVILRASDQDARRISTADFADSRRMDALLRLFEISFQSQFFSTLLKPLSLLKGNFPAED